MMSQIEKNMKKDNLKNDEIEENWVPKKKYEHLLKECHLWYKLWLEERYNRFLEPDQ